MCVKIQLPSIYHIIFRKLGANVYTFLGLHCRETRERNTRGERYALEIPVAYILIYILIFMPNFIKFYKNYQPRPQSNFKKIESSFYKNPLFRLPLIAKRCAGDKVEKFFDINVFFLCEKKTIPYIKTQKSHFKILSSGVSQGSIAGLLVFYVFINNLSLLIKRLEDYFCFATFFRP